MLLSRLSASFSDRWVHLDTVSRQIFGDIQETQFQVVKMQFHVHLKTTFQAEMETEGSCLATIFCLPPTPRHTTNVMFSKLCGKKLCSARFVKDRASRGLNLWVNSNLFRAKDSEKLLHSLTTNELVFCFTVCMIIVRKEGKRHYWDKWFSLPCQHSEWIIQSFSIRWADLSRKECYWRIFWLPKTNTLFQSSCWFCAILFPNRSAEEDGSKTKKYQKTQNIKERVRQPWNWGCVSESWSLNKIFKKILTVLHICI